MGEWQCATRARSLRRVLQAGLEQLEGKSIVHFKCVNFHTRDDKLQLTRHKRKLEALVPGPWLLQDLLDFYV
jgi:hypothetical protein